MKDAQQKPRLSRKHRRVFFVLVGVGVGLLCKVVPPHYQLLCSGAAKVISIFMGTP